MRFLIAAAILLLVGAQNESTFAKRRVKRVAVCISSRETCYNDILPLGCFKCRNRMRPDAPEDFDATFKLYSREATAPLKFRVRTMKSFVKETKFLADSTVIFVVHGFGKDRIEWMDDYKDRLLNISEKYFVITVDWREGTAFPNYLQGVLNTEVVGRTVGVLIQWIHQYHGVKLSQFRIIGFSLGAQVAGFAGDFVREKNEKIGAIFAIEPAGPFFRKRDGDPHLKKEAAQYVEVLHTSGSNVFYDGYSDTRLTGHVDFYANGGVHQPGCQVVDRRDLGILDFLGSLRNTRDSFGCPHNAALGIFARTIVPNPYSDPYIAYRCDSPTDWASAMCFGENVATKIVGYKHEVPAFDESAEGESFYFGTPWTRDNGAGFYYKVKVVNSGDENSEIYINRRHLMGKPGSAKTFDIFFPMTSKAVVGTESLGPPGISYRTAVVAKEDDDLDGVEHRISAVLALSFKRIEKPTNLNSEGNAVRKMIDAGEYPMKHSDVLRVPILLLSQLLMFNF